MFSLLIRSYKNLCWVGDPQERQNAHLAASSDLLMMVKDMMWATKKKYQISTWVASSYYKFVFTSPSSCWGVEWAPGAACDNLCHLFQMSRNEIALKIFQISFWRRICILLPPFCWTLKDQILLGCFTVWFSPSFPAVSVLILAEWGPCGIRSPECCT